MRLADLGVKLAHHIEVQRGMSTDREEPAFLDAMLVDHEMRMQVVGVLVQGSDIAPDIPILTGAEDSLPPFPSDDLGALGVHPSRKTQNDVIGVSPARRACPSRRPDIRRPLSSGRIEVALIASQIAPGALNPLFPGDIIEKALQLLRRPGTAACDAFDDRLPATRPSSVPEKRPGMTFLSRAETGRGAVAAATSTTPVIKNMTEDQILDGRRPGHFGASEDVATARANGDA